ncbi:hypothetical protein [Paenibacillus xylaniclasticus]|uniref:hypothetical protein n=1 Tax=Paenibacillus xylaniclasticus TaxID=588083 RepID=UPI000FD8E15D|nr:MULTISPECIES: hypothetical protein [Paenibacillus]GFN33353.1 hypothetical protein PCURB6_36130 [Paenibacillus curdlanolyticus]
MEPVFPLHEENINRFCGLPVCIVTHDGHRHVGILTQCRNGRVMLNGYGSGQVYIDQHKSDTAGKKTKNKKKAKEQPVQDDKLHAHTQAYGYYGYNPWGAAFAIDLALIAFLFLLL